MTNPAITLFQRLDISPSPQRVAVYNYLYKHRTHPTADEIFRSLRKTMPTISLTTIYNSLRILAEKHAIQTVIIEDGELRYDAETCPHAHFRCRICGHVTDVFPSAGHALLENAPVPPRGFRVEEEHLCYKGICAACAPNSR